MPHFTVFVTKIMKAYDYVVVEADSRDEAEEKAHSAMDDTRASEFECIDSIAQVVSTWE